MRTYTCPRCKEVLPTQNAVDLHLLAVEGCYRTGEDIANTLNSKITTYTGQVEYLLRLLPFTRSSDVDLEDWHSIIFTHTKRYNYETHKVEEIAGHKVHAHIIKQDSLGRPARYLKALDREEFHSEEGSVPKEHSCILPTEYTEEKTSILQRLYRSFYGHQATL